MNMTLQQAMKVAADLEERGCLNEPAKAARVLLAHINSMASPQVTDEQIVEAIRQIDNRHLKRVSTMHESIAIIRALLSAPLAAKTPLDYEAERTEAYRQGIHDERVRQAEERKAASQEANPNVSAVNTSEEYVQDSTEIAQKAKPVAADAQEFQYLCMAWGESEFPEVKLVSTLAEAREVIIGFCWEPASEAPTVQRSEMQAEFDEQFEEEGCYEHTFEIGGMSVKKVVLHSAAAPQEQAPAVDRDAVIEEVAKHVWQYKATEVIPSHLMLEISGICKWIRALQSQPQQVTK